MAIEISPEAAEKVLQRKLLGEFFDAVNYNITSWSLRFTTSEANSIKFVSCEISLPEIECWRLPLKRLPIDVQNTNEPDDGIVALALFSALNGATVTAVTINETNAVELSFSNDLTVIAKGTDLIADRVWAFYSCDETIINDGEAIYSSQAISDGL